MKYAFLFVFLLLYTVSFSQSDDRVKLRDLQSPPASTSDYVIFAVNDTAGWKQITEYNGDTVIVWHPTLKKFGFIHKDSISTPLPDSLAYGTGTTNYLSRWIAPFTLGTAGISDDGSEIQFARPTVLYGVNTAAATYGTFGIDNTLGIERPTYYNGSAWVPWLAYSGGTNQYSYFSNSNTITSGTQLYRDANGVNIGDGNYFRLPSNSTVGSMLTTEAQIEYDNTFDQPFYRDGVGRRPIGEWYRHNNGWYLQGSITAMGVGNTGYLTNNFFDNVIGGNGSIGSAMFGRIASNSLPALMVLANQNATTAFEVRSFINSNLLTLQVDGTLKTIQVGTRGAVFSTVPGVGGLFASAGGIYVPVIILKRTDQTANLLDFRSVFSSGLTPSSTNVASFNKDGWYAVGSQSARYSIDVANTNAIGLPIGTTAQRPTIVASTAPIRFNSDSTAYEGGYGVGDWRLFADRTWVNTQIGAIPSYTGFTPAADSGTGSNVASGGTLQVNGSGSIFTSVSDTIITIDNNRFGNYTYTEDSIIVDGTNFFGDGIAVYKGFLFSMSNSADSLYVFDIYNDYNVVSKFPVAGTSSPFIHAWNDKLTVTRSDSIRVYDIKDLNTPILLYKQLSGVINFPTQYNQFVFSSGGTNDIYIFNTETFQTDTVIVPRSNVLQANSLAYDDGYLYAVGVDASPDSIFIVNTNTKSYVNAYGQDGVGTTTYTYIFAQDKYLYALRSDTIDILNLADPENPVLVSKTKSFSGSGPFTRGLKVYGNYLIHCFSGGGFVVYDISDKTNVVALDTVYTTIASNTRGFDIYDNKIYLLSRNEPTIVVYDLPSIETGHLRSATIHTGKVRAENLISKEIEVQGLVASDLVVNQGVILSGYDGTKTAAALSKTESGYILGLATDNTVIEIPDSTLGSGLVTYGYIKTTQDTLANSDLTADTVAVAKFSLQSGVSSGITVPIDSTFQVNSTGVYEVSWEGDWESDTSVGESATIFFYANGSIADTIATRYPADRSNFKYTVLLSLTASTDNKIRVLGEDGDIIIYNSRLIIKKL